MSDLPSYANFTQALHKDTSICEHLRTYLSPSIKSDGDVKVKTEEGVSQAEVVDHEKKVATALKRFCEVASWGAVAEGAGTKRRKVSPPSCASCKRTLTRPWACLTSPYIGCSPLPGPSSSNKTCFSPHWSSSISDSSHNFAIDPTSGAIYCTICSDLTYPDTIETLFRQAKTRMEEENDNSREQSVAGRSRGSWKPWVRGEAELELPRSCCRGLRPLLNLSQTCFLSAILQSLLHNPLLKAYFLSDKHNRHVCANGSRGLAVGKPYTGLDNGNGNGSGNGEGREREKEKGCMCCEMDRAFEEFHNEDKSPFGPVTMLYAMWHSSAELEGYGQQDAHSFFLAALDQIHAHAKGQLSSCNCIAHQTFAGSLLSRVTCSNCSHSNTTIDPILDIQLDFPPQAAPGSNDEIITLGEMLRRFCAEEKVGDVGVRGYECSNCGGGPGTVAMRKLMVKKLAPVLSFQLKRFAHNATSTKVESPIRFPSYLDMKPYVEHPSDEKDLPSSLYAYDLFAVVTHEGKLDNGHYWADVRCGEEWWHCDDDKVTPTSLSSVLSQKAYMLFYVKRSLAYAQPGRNGLAGKSQVEGHGGHPIRGMEI